MPRKVEIDLPRHHLIVAICIDRSHVRQQRPIDRLVAARLAWLECKDESNGLSGVGGAGLVSPGCPFVDVVGPGSDAALVVPEAGFDVVGEQGNVACSAFFGSGIAGSPVVWVVMLRSLRGAGGPAAR
jgi:hypothetical protein